MDFSELIAAADPSIFTESIKAWVSGLNINSVIMLIMMIFMIVGAIDRIRGNKLGYGEKFEDGFNAIGGLVMNMTPYKMDIGRILINLVPVIVIAALIVIGLWFAPGPMINGFNKFGTGVTVVITVLTAIAVFQQITGIMFPVFDVMSTVDPDLGMTPLNNGLLVCGQIGIVLIGAFPMVEWITRTFGGALSKLGGALGMNDKGSAGLVATLANNIAMFNIMGEMNPKGKILNVAFAVSAAFVFGDHLGFAAGNDAQMIFPMIAGKLVAGVTALIVANLLAPKLLSKIQTISK